MLINNENINLSLNVPDNKEFIDVIINNINSGYYYRISVDKVYSDFNKITGNCFRCELKGDPYNEIINKIEIFSKQDSEMKLVGEIEIRKETEEFLKNRYNFSMKYGYLTIFRCTFDLFQNKLDNEFKIITLTKESSEEKMRVAEMLCNFHPYFIRILKINSQNPLIMLLKAELITKYLWNIYRDTGPNDLIDYQVLTTYQKLKIIKEQGGTVQCDDTRNLFIDIAYMFQPNLIIRKVDAFRYYPPIKNIVVNGHSVLELKCGTQWFLFDPYVRIYFKDSKENLLSASDIQNLRQTSNLDQVIPVHVPTNHPYRTDFESDELPYDPYGYNYFSHFGHLIYTNIII